MPITNEDVEAALAATSEPAPGSYGDTESMLYAVAIGMGRDPLDDKELPFICETVGQKVVPTAATVLARPDRGAGAPRGMSLMSKMNFALMLHGEQRLTVHQPLPRATSILVGNRTTGVYDKGEGKGALVTSETDVTTEDGTPLFTLGTTLFFRGDGGFGGTSAGAPEPHVMPEREPDLTIEMEQRPEQAFIYALCGDRNPLHRDPAFAKKAGFPRPILHGLCSYGIACHAVLKGMLDYDSDAIASFDVRFSSPVFPGETQAVDLWRDGDVISFRVRIPERGVVSINNGRCALR